MANDILVTAYLRVAHIAGAAHAVAESGEGYQGLLDRRVNSIFLSAAFVLDQTVNEAATEALQATNTLPKNKHQALKLYKAVRAAMNESFSSSLLELAKRVCADIISDAIQKAKKVQPATPSAVGEDGFPSDEALCKRLELALN